jgi:prepilin-type N-terminal cleavage/methylation domain-containing protein
MQTIKDQCPNCGLRFRKCDCKWKQIRQTLNDRKKHKGTTLIELLTVLAIIAIISGIAIPSYVSMTRGTKLRNAARLLTVELQEARSRAVALRHSVYVDFDTTKQAYRHRYTVEERIPDTSAPGKWKYIKAEKVSDWLLLPAPITFYDGTEAGKYRQAPAYIKCKPNGSMTDDEGSIGIFVFTIIEQERDKTCNIRIDGTFGRTKAIFE